MNPRVVRWFTPGLHVKRWLILLMVGMVLVSLGIGYALANFYRSGPPLPHIFYYLTLQFWHRYVRGALFGALGLSDHEILEREFIVYDALYAECKRQVSRR